MAININMPTGSSVAGAYPSSQRIKEIALDILKNESSVFSNRKNYDYARVTFNNNKHPHLLIVLHSRSLALKKVIKVNLDKDYNVLSTSLDEPKTTPRILAQCPNKDVKFLISNPCNGTEEDIKAFDYSEELVYAAAVAKYGENYVTRLHGSGATVKNFQDYLSCPNLDGVLSMATHDEVGQSFFLYDGTFDYKFFYDQPNLNYNNTIISFCSCYSYNNAKPGLCQAITELSPKVYTGGITPLTMYGAPEAYACFWSNVLSQNKQPTSDFLEECARKNDPFAKDSQSPLYIIGPKYEEHETSFDYFKITTNLSSYTVTRDDFYIRLSLAPDESVEKVTLIDKGLSFDCNGVEGQLHQPGLKANEFFMDYNGKKCNIIHFKAPDLPHLFPKGYAEYGMYPYDQCGG